MKTFTEQGSFGSHVTTTCWSGKIANKASLWGAGVCPTCGQKTVSFYTLSFNFCSFCGAYIREVMNT